MCKSSKSPYHIHVLSLDCEIVNTTLLKPNVAAFKSIIGLKVVDVIDPLDVPLYMDTFKKVVAEKTYDFVAYSVRRWMNFLSLLVYHTDTVLCFELARSPLSDVNCQKKMLLDAARGLIDNLAGCREEQLTLQ